MSTAALGPIAPDSPRQASGSQEIQPAGPVSTGSDTGSSGSAAAANTEIKIADTLGSAPTPCFTLESDSGRVVANIQDDAQAQIPEKKPGELTAAEKGYLDSFGPPVVDWRRAVDEARAAKEKGEL